MDSMCKRQIILLRSLWFTGGRLSTGEIIKISLTDWDTTGIWSVFDKTLVQGRLALAYARTSLFAATFQKLDTDFWCFWEWDPERFPLLIDLTPFSSIRWAKAPFKRRTAGLCTRYYLGRLISKSVVVARTPTIQTNNFIDTARMWNMNGIIKVRCKL